MTLEPVVCIFPHSDREFRTTDKLRDFLLDELPDADRGGEYLLRKLGWKDKDLKARVVPGSLVLFRKHGVIVGDAVVNQPITELIPPDGDYHHKIVFDPESIRIYPTDLNVSRIEAWADRHLYAGRYAIVGLREDYEKTFIPL